MEVSQLTAQQSADPQGLLLNCCGVSSVKYRNQVVDLCLDDLMLGNSDPDQRANGS